MRLWLYAAIPILLGSPVGADESAPDGAGRAFRANCMGCHQAPDLRFESDRAWLDQIHRTA